MVSNTRGPRMPAVQIRSSASMRSPLASCTPCASTLLTLLRSASATLRRVSEAAA